MHRSKKIVSEDLACSKCEYNLRGLSLDSKCPECGMLIRDTMKARTSWSIAHGFREAIKHEFFWGLICFAGLGAILWTTAPLLNSLRGGSSGFRGGGGALGLATMICALPMLYVLWYCLREAAGFHSVLLGGLAVVSIAIVAGSSTALAYWFGPLALRPAIFFGIATPFGAFFIIAFDCLRES